jgi:hypothetical protein
MQDKNTENQDVENLVQDALEKEKTTKVHRKKGSISATRIVGIVIVALSFTAGFFTNQFINNDKTDNENDVLVIQQSDSASTEDENSSSEAEEEEAVSSSWLLFESIEYSVRLPDGWDFQHQDNGVLLMRCGSELDCYQLNPGTQATVEEILGGSDGLQGLLVTIQPAGITESELTADYTLDSNLGNGFTLHTSVKTTEPNFEAIGDSLPKDTKQYIATKTLPDNRVAYFGYSVVPGQTDPTETIKEMIATFIVL